MQKLTSKFAAGLRPAGCVSHTACMTHFQEVPTEFSYKYSKLMSQIGTSFHASIDSKICCRTLSACLCQAYIKRDTFPLGFNIVQLQLHQKRCYKLQLVYLQKLTSKFAT
jgi:hypothetical protein